MSLLDAWAIQHKTWGLGRLESQPIKSVGGFYYVAKYMSKNYTSDTNAKWDRREGKYINPGRLYTWSNKPVLGQPGLTRWNEIIEIWTKQFDGIPPNWLNMNIFGKMKKVYIPKDAYMRKMRDLGISLVPGQKGFRGLPADIDVDEIDLEIASWREKGVEQDSLIQLQ